MFSRIERSIVSSCRRYRGLNESDAVSRSSKAGSSTREPVEPKGILSNKVPLLQQKCIPRRTTIVRFRSKAQNFPTEFGEALARAAMRPGAIKKYF